MLLTIGWDRLVGIWSFFFFQAEDGIRDLTVTGVQTCALPISHRLALRRQPALPAHREAPREGRLARARGGLRDAGRRLAERAGFGHGRSPRAGRALMSSRLVPVLFAAGGALGAAALVLLTGQ